MAFLSVAVKKPLQPLETYHWPLCIHDETTNPASHTTFEVFGSPGTFQYNEESACPGDSTRHDENIPVAWIDDMEYFFKVVRAQAIDNDMFHRGCQQWVLDVLETLTEEDVVGAYEHAEAKDKLVAIFQVQIEGDG